MPSFSLESLRAYTSIGTTGEKLVPPPPFSRCGQTAPLSLDACRCNAGYLTGQTVVYAFSGCATNGPCQAQANLHPHGVSFAEAGTVLEEEFALTREDPHSVSEQRFVTLGMSSAGSLLVMLAVSVATITGF